MTLSALKPKADLERLATAGRIVVEAIAPRRLSNLMASFQWVRPSQDSDYDQARSGAAEQALGQPASGQYLDYAAVVDGNIPEPKTTYHLEAGVAHAAEIATRLNGAFVRIRGTGQGGNIDAPPTLWPADSLPAYALFCNSTWELTKDLSVTGWDDASSHFQSVRKAGLQIVDSLFSVLDTTPTQETE